MPRTTLAFTTSDASTLQNLVDEFALHDDVRTEVDASSLTLRVETLDTPSAIWDVRATVWMFDDRAAEIEAQE